MKVVMCLFKEGFYGASFGDRTCNNEIGKNSENRKGIVKMTLHLFVKSNFLSYLNRTQRSLCIPLHCMFRPVFVQ